MPQSFPNMNVRPLHQDATLEEIRQYLLELDAFLQQYVVGSFADAQSAEEGLAAVRQTIDDHTKRKDNPHEVTAQQVGAYPAGSKVADSERLNGQPASYYTNIPARLGYTPVNKAGDTLDGQFVHDSDSNKQPFYFSRTGSTSKEYMSVGLNDSRVEVVVNNDETTAGIRIKLEATDTESGGGANANNGTIEISTSTSGRKITVDGNTVWHAGNDGSGSGLDADLLDGQHGSYYAKASDLDAHKSSGDHDSRYWRKSEFSISTGASANTVAKRDSNGDLTARVLKPTQYLQLPVLSSDPSSPPNGAIWMRS